MILTYLVWIREFCALFGPETVMNTNEMMWPDAQGRANVIAKDPDGAQEK
jgi:hypothetical protein